MSRSYLKRTMSKLRDESEGTGEDFIPGNALIGVQPSTYAGCSPQSLLQNRQLPSALLMLPSAYFASRDATLNAFSQKDMALISANQQSAMSSLTLENQRLKDMLTARSHGCGMESHSQLEDKSAYLRNFSHSSLSSENKNIAREQPQNVPDVAGTIQHPVMIEEEEEHENDDQYSIGSSMNVVDNETIPDSQLPEIPDETIHKLYLCNICKAVVFVSYDEVLKHQETCEEEELSQADEAVDEDEYSENGVQEEGKTHESRIHPNEDINSYMLEMQTRMREEEDLEIREESEFEDICDSHLEPMEVLEMEVTLNSENTAGNELIKSAHESPIVSALTGVITAEQSHLSHITIKDALERNKNCSLTDALQNNPSKMKTQLLPQILVKGAKKAPSKKQPLVKKTPEVLMKEIMESSREKSSWPEETLTISLSMPEDEKCLIPAHCFVRVNFLHIFRAIKEDTVGRKVGRGKPVTCNQIGIGCPYCLLAYPRKYIRGAVYFPSKVEQIYGACFNLLQRHLPVCEAMPEGYREHYEDLKGDDGRSGSSKQYWIQSAIRLGLVSTSNGIRYMPESLDASLVPSSQLQATSAMAASSLTTSGQVQLSINDVDESVVSIEDQAHTTEYLYYLMTQLKRCYFSEADNIGKRSYCDLNFPGITCKYCHLGCGKGRIFSSSFKSFSDPSKTTDKMYQHMLKCRDVPMEVKNKLISLKDSHSVHKKKRKFGFMKLFYARVWEKLHS